MNLRHRRHALAVQIDFADPLDPGQHVIGRLAPDPDQFRANDPSHEIAWQIENVLRGGPFKSLAQNCGHGPSEGLHLGPQRHAYMRFAVIIYVQINTDSVCAFLIFPDVLQIELLSIFGLLFAGSVCVGDERLSPFIFRQRFEKIDNVFQLCRIVAHCAGQKLPARDPLSCRAAPLLHSGRMPDLESSRFAAICIPSRAGIAAIAQICRVQSQARDYGKGMSTTRIDSDPSPAATFSVTH